MALYFSFQGVRMPYRNRKKVKKIPCRKIGGALPGAQCSPGDQAFLPAMWDILPRRKGQDRYRYPAVATDYHRAPAAAAGRRYFTGTILAAGIPARPYAGVHPALPVYPAFGTGSPLSR